MLPPGTHAILGKFALRPDAFLVSGPTLLTKDPLKCLSSRPTRERRSVSRRRLRASSCAAVCASSLPGNHGQHQCRPVRGVVENRLTNLLKRLEHIQGTAHQGRLLRDGMTIVLAGKPNAGKSSLLNVLAGHDAAIVTDIAGTTRDVLRERIQIDGMPLHIIDTAGLRDSDNAVELEGIRRAREEIKKADKVLLLVDSTDPEMDPLIHFIPENVNITRVVNKIDLAGIDPAVRHTESGTQIYLSVKTGAGMNLLVQHLKESVGFTDTGEDVFIARTRHLEALKKSREALENALVQLTTNLASELVAEELRIAQQALAEITGEFSSDDLLGKIFSSFCIGK